MSFRFTMILAGVFCCSKLLSQELEPGLPPSFSPEFSQVFLQKQAPALQIAPPDLKKIKQEDADSPFQSRFAVSVETDISTENFGQTYNLPDGRKVWRGEITAPGALGLILLFDNFQIPPGGQFFAFDTQKRVVQGAFTSKSCRSDNRMLVGVLPGETAVLEYILPVGGHHILHLNRIGYGYHPDVVANVAASPEFGTSLTCHTNVNCQVANNYFREKKSVARILMAFSNGQFAWCTGSLIANTEGTSVPYFLTAQHCEIIMPGTPTPTPDFSMWRFDFGYQGAGCQTPGTEPTFTSVLGCQRIAGRAQTDFLLLKLNPLPQNLDVYFAGWNRSETPAENTGFIHHPKGDIKKFSSSSAAATIWEQNVTWGGNFGTSQPNTHFDVKPDVGTFQGGSSGCPLFDHTLRIVGQLHGGTYVNNQPCFVEHAFFGRFSLSWTGNAPNQRLKEWLDPQNLNPQTQDGYFPPVINEFDVSGKVVSAWGVPMPKVKVSVSGGQTQKNTLTDSDGNYSFLKLLGGQDYNIIAEKDTNDINGISTNDLLQISKHLLEVSFLDSPWKILATDVNDSNSLTTNDIVETRKLIIGLSNGLTAVPSWRFYPAGTMFSNPLNPFPAPTNVTTILNLKESKVNVNFYGIKMGDPNQSADAKK